MNRISIKNVGIEGPSVDLRHAIRRHGGVLRNAKFKQGKENWRPASGNLVFHFPTNYKREAAFMAVKRVTNALAPTASITATTPRNRVLQLSSQTRYGPVHLVLLATIAPKTRRKTKYWSK
ncbi:MAG TPA: hypothetical protein VGQ00_04565 [Candidatus Norongarragalinales archaeon]|nr:hypothetical protein [Candidatus Norongarragalinales archaeon]